MVIGFEVGLEPMHVMIAFDGGLEPSFSRKCGLIYVRTVVFVQNDLTATVLVVAEYKFLLF